MDFSLLDIPDDESELTDLPEDLDLPINPIMPPSESDSVATWFPTYRIVENHPLWSYGISYVYRNLELDAAQLEARKIWAANLQVPATLDDAELQRQGRTGLLRGQAVFCQVTNSMADDIFKVANTPKEFITDDLDAALTAMMNEVIGDKDACGPQIPQEAVEYDSTGPAPREGGTVFERLLPPKSGGSQGARCYANGIICEQGANIIEPTRTLKGEATEFHRNRGKWNSVCVFRIYLKG